MADDENVTDRPLILVSNDDGIDADGLWALAEAMQSVGEVCVVAPAFEQSGMGTAFTLHRELQSQEARSRLPGVEAWQVDGTPTDAVIIGLRRHVPRRVSLVVSGVNPGPNLGADVIHSGTVGAAMQGHHRDLPAVAVSSLGRSPARLRAAASVGAGIAASLLASGERLFLNVNVPDRPSPELGQAVVTELAPRGVARLIEAETAEGLIRPRREYQMEGVEAASGLDVWAILQGKISVSPLETDLRARPETAEKARTILS